jgi:molybdenum cofactor synthesis domain-containing protein
VIELEEAQAFVLAGCAALAPSRTPLAGALGYVLAAPVVAGHDVPPFATSAMDGYALRAADVSSAPARLAVVGSLLAGAAPTVPVGPGQAVRIMTGAPLPDGADAVCMIELTSSDDGGSTVVIAEAVPPGHFVRRAGEDVATGQVVFEAGTELTPAHLGVLATLGTTEVEVFGRPTVGVLSTGDELTDDPGALAPGKIRDANRASLLATLAEDGYPTVDLGIVVDDRAAITAAIAEGAARCDAIVASGGVSVGDVDYVKVVLDDLSAGAMRWMQVAIRPARPLAFGNLAADGTPVFGLPGNPVSALVSYELFVRPGLRQMAGLGQLGRPLVRAVCDEDLTRRPDGKLHLVRVLATVAADGAVHVRPTGAQESHLLHLMALANALALLPDGPGVPAGAPVDVLLLRAGSLTAAPAAVAGPRGRA